MIERFGNITDTGISCNQRRNERDVLKEHFLILVLFPDSPSKQLIDAVCDIIAVGNVVGQIDLFMGIS